jgi:hypothetical protein
MRREKIYSCTIILLGIIQVLPIFLLLGSTIILLGVVYAVLLWKFWRSTRIGRWFLREWWRSTLLLERIIFGGNAEC